MHFALAVAIALNFWGARNVHVPCTPIPFVGADAQLPKDAWGWPAAMGHERLPDPDQQHRSGQRHSARCGTARSSSMRSAISAGLPHTDAASWPTGRTAPRIPWDCYHWKRFAREHHIPLRR
jgi:hypothetical protein